MYLNWLIVSVFDPQVCISTQYPVESNRPWHPNPTGRTSEFTRGTFYRHARRRGCGLCLASSSEDVQRPVRRPDVARSDEDDVDQGPDAEAAEAEQLADALPPQTQVEPVGAEAPESDTGTERTTYVTSRHVTSRHVTSRHVTSSHARDIYWNRTKNIRHVT